MAKNQIKGGNFQDESGLPLNLGYLTFEISNDEQITSPLGQVCSDIVVKVALDATGNVPLSPVVSLWPNDQLNPANSQYIVKAYTAKGQLVWGPNYVTIPSSPSPYDLGNMVPQSNGSGVIGNPVLLQTNGVNNGDQEKLNLKNGTGISIVDDGSGGITINGGAGLTLKTNGANNTSQTVLNMKDGNGIAITSDGVGGVTVDGALLQTDGVDNNAQDKLNLVSGTGITITDNGAGAIEIAAGSSALTNSFIWGGQGLFPVFQNSTAISYDPVTKVNIVQMVITERVTLSNAAAFLINGGGTPENVTFALYNLAGNRVLYCGDNAMTIGAGTSALATCSFSPVTLAPGTYWFAGKTSNTVSSGWSAGSNANSSAVVNAGSTRFGTAVAPAGNTAVLAATLGAVTADITRNGVGVCMFY